MTVQPVDSETAILEELATVNLSGETEQSFLTLEGEVVYDPFLGRGTTVIEAASLGRTGWGIDVNPLSQTLVLPRFRGGRRP
ncbi:MAG: DNA methyltransferase [Verrucomicrobia bacterium]|nr:DNA methyltransferase [Verrucomicrobiota bacterium]